MEKNYIAQPIANAVSVRRIVTLHYFEFGKNFVSGQESHDFWEMVYLDKGRCIAMRNGRQLILQQGDCLFHAPNEPHALLTDGTVAPNVFIISFVCRSRAMAYLEGRLLHLPLVCRRYISAMLAEGEKAYLLPFNNPDLRELVPNPAAPLGAQQMVRTNLEQLLITLIRQGDAPARLPDGPTEENGLVNEVRRLFEAHLYEKYTVTQACATLNYSRAYVSRVFKSRMGVTVAQYALRMKLEEARRLIRESESNLGEISDRLGFENQHAFSRAFHRVTGMTPTEYRRSTQV